jgi:hypothetical protein
MNMNMIRPRVARLHRLVAELGRDYTRWKDEPTPLLDGERRAYLIAIQEALAGIDEAAVVLSKAIARRDALGMRDDGA